MYVSSKASQVLSSPPVMIPLVMRLIMKVKAMAISSTIAKGLNLYKWNYFSLVIVLVHVTCIHRSFIYMK